MTAEVRGDNEYGVWILPPTRRDGVATCDVLRRADISCEVSRDPMQLADQIRAVGDDNMDAATSLAEFLELDGHAVKAVHTAEAALQDVHSFHPVLCFWILDCRLSTVTRSPGEFEKLDWLFA